MGLTAKTNLFPASSSSSSSISVHLLLEIGLPHRMPWQMFLSHLHPQISCYLYYVVVHQARRCPTLLPVYGCHSGGNTIVHERASLEDALFHHQSQGPFQGHNTSSRVMKEPVTHKINACFRLVNDLEFLAFKYLIWRGHSPSASGQTNRRALLSSVSSVRYHWTVMRKLFSINKFVIITVRGKVHPCRTALFKYLCFLLLTNEAKYWPNHVKQCMPGAGTMICQLLGQVGI